MKTTHTPRHNSRQHGTEGRISRSSKAVLTAAALTLLASCSGSESTKADSHERTPAGVEVGTTTAKSNTPEVNTRTDGNLERRRGLVSQTREELKDRGEQLNLAFTRAQNLSSTELVKRGLSLQVVRFKGTEQRIFGTSDGSVKLVAAYYPDRNSGEEHSEMVLDSVEVHNEKTNRVSGLSVSAEGPGEGDVYIYDRPTSGATEPEQILRAPTMEDIFDGDDALVDAEFQQLIDKRDQTGVVFSDSLAVLTQMLDH